MTVKRKHIRSELPATNPIIIYEDTCIGCNQCVDICQVDLLIPSPDETRKAPWVLYPGECWYCGSCVEVCPVEGAIELHHSLMNQVHWIEKSALKKA